MPSLIQARGKLRVFAVSTFLHRGPLERPKQFSLVQRTPWNGAPPCSDRGVALSPSSVGAFHSITPSKGEHIQTRVRKNGTLAESKQLVGYSGPPESRECLESLAHPSALLAGRQKLTWSRPSCMKEMFERLWMAT